MNDDTFVTSRPHETGWEEGEHNKWRHFGNSEVAGKVGDTINSNTFATPRAADQRGGTMKATGNSEGARQGRNNINSGALVIPVE